MTPEMAEFIRRCDRARELEEEFLRKHPVRCPPPGPGLSVPNIGRPKAEATPEASPPRLPGTLVPWSKRPFCLQPLADHQAACLGEVIDEAGHLRCSSCSATHEQISANLAARRKKAARERDHEKERSRARRRLGGGQG